MAKIYRILLVEDDATMVDTIKYMMQLAPYGSKLQIISNGDDALEALRREKPDAMILDLMLPGLSGQELLKTLDADPGFIGFPVLVNSTVADMTWTNQEVQACRNLRIEIAPRPCSHEEVIEKIQSLLGIL